MRLNQFLARAGLGSRRSVESLIASGRVMVAGVPAGLATTLDPSRDTVTLDGKPVRLPPEFTYIMLHKPPGYTVTRSDPRARRTVYELLPVPLRRLAYVGRLDRESEGVLLFTDDGELTHRLLRPEYGIEREYRVQSDVAITEAAMERVRSGVRLPDGHLARPERVGRPGDSPGDAWFELVIREGKKREVRQLCRAAGITVLRLVRERFGPVELGRLAPGKHRALAAPEVEALRKSVARRKKPLSQSADKK